MRYIVNSEEISRDTFYFCQKAKDENKSFVLLKPDTYVDYYINNHPEYDYYIRNNISTYFTKGKDHFNEWYEKDENSYSWSKASIGDMTKRYNKSKFKDTMTFEEWYKKNNWKYFSETKYESEDHDIPPAGDFEDEEVKIKLFSVKVKNEDTVMTINDIRKQYGDLGGDSCIKYVLRENGYTEIIYRDCYKEI